METFDRNDVEAAFRRYWQVGAVGEDWEAWVTECFTPDVDYIEHVLGTMHGRDEVTAWITTTMAQYPEIYTVYEWHMVGDDGRVVVYMQNRRDHPDPTQPPIDFPGITILQYAGDGQFGSEEDFWAVPKAGETFNAYRSACAEHDPEHPSRRTRRDWGNGPAWAIGGETWADSLAARRAAGDA